MCKYQKKAVASIKTKNSKCQLTIDPYENKWKHGSKIEDMDGTCSSQQANSTIARCTGYNVIKIVSDL